MAAELGLLSLIQFHRQKITQSQPNQLYHQPSNSSSGMWNPKQAQKEDDDSWEVRAFKEDTGNIMGTTWPPRFYTCNFCRREFRSAQALGGHMNVHRRDRARIHQTHPPVVSSTSNSSSSSTFVIPTQEFSTSNGGLCLLYQLPNPNEVFTPTAMNACATGNLSPSTVLSISPYPHKKHLVGQSLNYPILGSTETISSHFHSTGKGETSMSVDDNSTKELKNEEVDLELRLGHRLATPPPSSTS